MAGEMYFQARQSAGKSRNTFLVVKYSLLRSFHPDVDFWNHSTFDLVSNNTLRPKMKISDLLLPLLSIPGVCAQFQQVTNFGSNPSKAKMYIYTPTNLPPNPAIVVGVHYCTGTGPGYYNGSPYKRLADQKKF